MKKIMLTTLAGLAVAAAQMNSECGVGETQLYVKVGGTDKLTKCTDYFDDVDPYATVMVGHDRLAVAKVTKRIDNDAEPQWDEVLDFGCVEQDSKISFRVRDWDYFSDEVCLGPLDILGTWPASAEPSVVCKEAEGKGCISFTLFYGPDVTLADANGGVADTTGTTITNPTITGPVTTPSRPDTPDAPQPTVIKRPANATHTPSTEEVTNRPNPITPPPTTPTPRVRQEPGGMPLSGAPVNSSTAPTTTTTTTTTDPPLASTKTRPSTSTQPRVQGPPPPPRAEEQEKSSRGGNSGAKKSAAVAGTIIGLLAFVGVGVGVYSSRRRRRAADHNQGLELDDPEAGRRGQPDEGGAGSIAVL